MADFCKECSIETFGKDFGDFAGIITEEQFKSNNEYYELCEGCGYARIDHEGNRINSKEEAWELFQEAMRK